MSSDNISSITGLTGMELQDFISFLFQKMYCDFKCEELQIYTEIYGLWEVYQKLRKSNREIVPREIVPREIGK